METQPVIHYEALISRLAINPAWLLVALGLAALYVPTYWGLANTLWQTDDQAHSAIIGMVIVYLFVLQGNNMFAAPYAPRNGLGSVILVIGLLLYAVGRSQDLVMFEVGSQIPVFMGTLLLMQGTASVRAAWFPLVYLIFMVPLPGMVVDSLTGSLKQWISVIAEESLHGLGYPIARNGVVITIAQYQLLVADACSGLNSMFSLMAIGLLYMYMAARPSWLHNGIMLASILPIAFIANVIRVLALILITYHFGDEVGQGFMHGFAGILLLVVAVLLLFTLDGLLSKRMSNVKL
jgi:exosortase B